MTAPNQYSTQERAQQPLVKRTDFPFVVTLLAAFLSWAVTHSVDRLISLPLVKFTQTEDVQPDGNHLTFEFSNLTSDVNFKDLTIRIVGIKSNQFSNTSTEIIGPGWDCDETIFGEKDGIEVNCPEFHPEWELRLSTVMTGEKIPRVQLEHSAVPTILEPASWRTFLIEYELFIIALFASVALVLIVVWAMRQ